MYYPLVELNVCAIGHINVLQEINVLQLSWLLI